MTIHEPSNLQAFKSLLSSNPYVVVDFHADWCPPCKAIAPLFKTLADTSSATPGIVFAKVNVDHAQDIAQEYGITAMPTFLFFEKGELFKERERIQGADPRGLQDVVGVLTERAKSAGAGAGAGAGGQQAQGQEGGEAKKEGEKEGETEGETVSGGYHFTQEQQHRSDWRTTLT